MTYFHLKLLAAIAMVIDHVGVVFFPGDDLFRSMGRLSFPLFAFLLAQGERHTRDVTRYLGRLLLLALLSQPIYHYVFPQGGQLNVLVTLALGLAVVRLGQLYPSVRYGVALLGVAIATLIPMDGGPYGMIVILLMARCPFPLEAQDGNPESPADNTAPRVPGGFSLRSPIGWVALWVGFHVVYILVLRLIWPIQMWAALTPLVLWAVTPRRGARARWFYGFYPGHLALLGGLRQILGP